MNKTESIIVDLNQQNQNNQDNPVGITPPNPAPADPYTPALNNQPLQQPGVEPQPPLTTTTQSTPPETPMAQPASNLPPNTQTPFQPDTQVQTPTQTSVEPAAPMPQPIQPQPSPMQPQALPPASGQGGGKKIGLIIAVVIGVLVLVGGSVAAFMLLGSKGRSEPEKAIYAMYDAIENQDCNKFVELLSDSSIGATSSREEFIEACDENKERVFSGYSSGEKITSTKLVESTDATAKVEVISKRTDSGQDYRQTVDLVKEEGGWRLTQ